MRRTTFAAVAVVALVALSGCAGLTGSNGGGIDASTVDDHESALTDTSFTTTINLTSQGFQTLSTVEVDPDDDQYLQSSTSLGQTTTVYTGGDTTYQRSGQGNQTTVQQVQQPVNATNARTGGQLFSTFISENITYDEMGTETVDGVEVTRYEATGVDAISESLKQDALSNTTLEDFSGTVLLDADGVIRTFEISITANQSGESVTTTYRVTVSDVGSTDVEEPAWISEAGQTTAA